MSNFLLTYDLRRDEEYEDLLDELREVGAVELQRSVWYLRSDDTCDQLSDHFGKFIDTTRDRLLVARVGDWAGFNNMGGFPSIS
jgi:CRISPR/Cas system-associated endoribonuclease Cas2